MGTLRITISLAALAASTSMLLMSSQDSSGFDTRGYPPEMVSAARMAEHRCSKCHSLGRVLEGDYSAAEWGRIVQEMARKEKSGISAPDAERITSLFSFRIGRKNPGAASRPGGKTAADSRPVRFGGPAAYPLATQTVYASSVIARSVPLPAALVLAGIPVVLRETSAGTDATGASRVTAKVVVSERETELSLARDVAGAFSSEVLTLRDWAIGPHTFRFVLALYETDAAPFSAARPGMSLALLVVRSSG